VALADNPRPAYPPPPPAYKPAPYKPAPSYSEPSYPDAAPQYNYQYAVKDDYAGVDFDANEERNNYATTGQYRVLLPDGRVQVRFQIWHLHSRNLITGFFLHGTHSLSMLFTFISLAPCHLQWHGGNGTFFDELSKIVCKKIDARLPLALQF